MPQDTSATGAASTPWHRVAQVVFPKIVDTRSIPCYVACDDQHLTLGEAATMITGRRTLAVADGTTASLCSYFNAFPAAYWRRWTTADKVRLQVSTTGSGTVVVRRSDARGNTQDISVHPVDSATTTVVDCPLAAFGDGGYIWFDLIAATDFALVEADWSVPDTRKQHHTVNLGITTFNRPDYCVNTLAEIAGSQAVRDVVAEVLIIDQGTDKVTAQDAYPALQQDLGSSLRIVDQANLGGSGGFARCMYETVTREQADAVILLDDDIRLEAESIPRLVAFSEHTKTQTIVGGHMFDMNAASVLHTMGEIVDPFVWQPACPNPDQELGHDFGTSSLSQTGWMHQRIDVDYNGWWMCLIPRDVIKELQLPLPIFIKWDDVEYGLRAKAANIPTVSLPGAAVWHVSWVDKDDLVGWQAFFHARNRMISALLHSPFTPALKLLRNATLLDIKHVVSMQYYTSHGRDLALDSVLAGPDQLHNNLPTTLPNIRGLAADFSDAQYSDELDSFPAVVTSKPKKPESSQYPSRLKLAAKGALAVVRQTLVPVADRAKSNPERHVAHKDSQWHRVARHDSALVSTADGKKVSWYRKDPELSRQLIARSVSKHASLAQRWTELKQQYEAAVPHITSVAAWEHTFGIGQGADTATLDTVSVPDTASVPSVLTADTAAVPEASAADTAPTDTAAPSSRPATDAAGGPTA